MDITERILPSTWRRAELALRNFFSWCPVRRVSRLTPELFERYAAHRRRKDGVSIRTVNIELTNVETCLNWGGRICTTGGVLCKRGSVAGPWRRASHAKGPKGPKSDWAPSGTGHGK